MVRRKLNRFIPVGLLLLCVGITLRSWMHTRYSAFAAGFLMGIALVFIIAGFVQQHRALSR
jgi:hypothetical protein